MSITVSPHTHELRFVLLADVVESYEIRARTQVLSDSSQERSFEQTRVHWACQTCRETRKDSSSRGLDQGQQVGAQCWAWWSCESAWRQDCGSYLQRGMFFFLSLSLHSLWETMWIWWVFSYICTSVWENLNIRWFQNIRVRSDSIIVVFRGRKH